MKFAPAAAWTSRSASPTSVPCRKPHWTSAVSPVGTCLTHTVVIPLEIPGLSVLPAWSCAFLSYVETRFLFINYQCATETALLMAGGMLWSA